MPVVSKERDAGLTTPDKKMQLNYFLRLSLSSHVMTKYTSRNMYIQSFLFGRMTHQFYKSKTLFEEKNRIN